MVSGVFDSESAYKCAPIHPRNLLLNCTDCVDRCTLQFTRIEKIFATSQGMFKYKEIVYVEIIFLENSSKGIIGNFSVLK
jgi:hypothetical protein